MDVLFALETDVESGTILLAHDPFLGLRMHKKNPSLHMYIYLCAYMSFNLSVFEASLCKEIC